MAGVLELEEIVAINDERKRIPLQGRPGGTIERALNGVRGDTARTGREDKDGAKMVFTGVGACTGPTATPVGRPQAIRMVILYSSKDLLKNCTLEVNTIESNLSVMSRIYSLQQPAKVFIIDLMQGLVTYSDTDDSIRLVLDEALPPNPSP